jgi:hypothetical protein
MCSQNVLWGVTAGQPSIFVRLSVNKELALSWITVCDYAKIWGMFVVVTDNLEASSKDLEHSKRR